MLRKCSKAILMRALTRYMTNILLIPQSLLAQIISKFVDTNEDQKIIMGIGSTTFLTEFFYGASVMMRLQLKNPECKTPIEVCKTENGASMSLCGASIRRSLNNYDEILKMPRKYIFSSITSLIFA